MKLLITCEHGGNNIPHQYNIYFKNKKKLLNTHRGYDLGALDLAKLIYEITDSQFYYSTISRSLIELNRSLHHPNLFSEVTKQFNGSEKQKIISKYYLPFRTKVEDYIKSKTVNDTVLHLSIHSFTPTLNGKVRNTDIGLLYDPKHKREKEYSKKLKECLKLIIPGLKVRFNYPYLGTMDGFTKYLRKVFSSRIYKGIEIEVNQKFYLRSQKEKILFQQLIVKGIKLSLRK